MTSVASDDVGSNLLALETPPTKGKKAGSYKDGLGDAIDYETYNTNKKLVISSMHGDPKVAARFAHLVRTGRILNQKKR